MPVAAAPIPASIDQLSTMPYEQMSPPEMEALPPAPPAEESMVQDQIYDQNQIFDQGQVYDQTQQYFDQGQTIDQGEIYDQTQYFDQGQIFDQTQAPLMEQDMNLADQGQSPPQYPGESRPTDPEIEPIMEPSVPEMIPADEDAPEKDAVHEGPDEVRKEDDPEENEESSSGLPPIPDLPDI